MIELLEDGTYLALSLIDNREEKGFIQLYTRGSADMIFMYARWVNMFWYGPLLTRGQKRSFRVTAECT
jgi:hypothetical protein